MTKEEVELATVNGPTPPEIESEALPPQPGLAKVSGKRLTWLAVPVPSTLDTVTEIVLPAASVMAIGTLVKQAELVRLALKDWPLASTIAVLTWSCELVDEIL